MCTLRLTDFGIATSRPSHASNTFLNLVGDYPIAHMAPESLNPPHVYSEKSDSFMFGALLFEMAAGERPWAGQQLAEVRRLVCEGKRLAAPPCIQAHPKLSTIYDACCHADPARRPSLADVVRHLHS